MSRADVVIGGAGMAASATALALLGSGIKPLLLYCDRPSLRMLEAIPQPAMPLFDALRVSDILRGMHHPASGIENSWRPERPVARASPLVVVERIKLAERLFAEAQARGASVYRCPRLPALRPHHDSITLELGAERRSYAAAIDATGRSAFWSRPVDRFRSMVAQVFAAPAVVSSQALAVLRMSDCWVYRLSSPDCATVTMVAPPGSRTPLSSLRLSRLGIPAGELRFIGRRAASAQWSRAPILDARVAVGDAALAHDPISGQGIRFALGSALAAAATVRTWLESPAERQYASDFYAEFVATERNRHLSFLERLYGFSSFEAKDMDYGRSRAGVIPGVDEVDSVQHLRFSGRTDVAGVNLDGRIRRGEVVRLSDGGAVRWAGGFDLLKLRDLMHGPTSIGRIVQMLADENLTRQQSVILVDWCLRKGILSRINR